MTTATATFLLRFPQQSLQRTNGIDLGRGQPLVRPGLACSSTRELGQKGHSRTVPVLCLQLFEFW